MACDKTKENFPNLFTVHTLWELWNNFLLEIMGQKLIKIVKIWKNGSVLVRLTEPAGSTEPPNSPNQQVRPNQNQNQKGSVVHYKTPKIIFVALKMTEILAKNQNKSMAWNALICKNWAISIRISWNLKISRILANF